VGAAKQEGWNRCGWHTYVGTSGGTLTWTLRRVEKSEDFQERSEKSPKGVRGMAKFRRLLKRRRRKKWRREARVGEAGGEIGGGMRQKNEGGGERVDVRENRGNKTQDTRWVI